MGLWSRYSPKKLESTTLELLRCADVTYRESRVEISKGNFMFCLEIGDTSKPVMILLHGYCGSGLIFYKILKGLSEHYYIYLVDHIGMGQSSRPSFSALSTYEAEEFFVEALEAFRRLKHLEEFVLAGHSFGGYISGCYALKYRKHVLKLLLLSPAGVTEKPTEGKSDIVWNLGWINKFLLFFWLKNISLIEITRKFGPLSGVIISSYMEGRYNLPEREMAVMREHLEQVILLPGSGEKGIYFIMDFELWPYSALSKRLPELNRPIAFFYGDRDWIIPDGGYRTKENSGFQVTVDIIKDSDHHMYWDNPDELLSKMLAALRSMEIN